MPRCKVSDCCAKRPCYNFIGLKHELFCAEHRQDGMVNVLKTKCAEDGCNIEPSYNYKGEAKRLYCSQHKREGMVRPNTIYCNAENCGTIATFNNEGGKPKYCNEHKDVDMVDVTKRRVCEQQGCKIRPCFNVPNDKIPKYCLQHRTEGMIDVTNTRICAKEGCGIRPCYNTAGEKQGLYCLKHKREHMINVVDHKCREEGCTLIPCFNYPECTNGLYCGKHKKPLMENVKDRKCAYTGCTLQSSYNFPNERIRLYCSKHKLPDMVDIANKLCMNNGCYTYSSEKYKSYCYRCFVYKFPNEKVAINHKVKEKHVADFVKESLQDVEMIFDKHLQGGCSKKRPDIFIERYSHAIIVEVDENQHNNYSCENKRMMEIFQDLGNRPLVFIRFNPDEYVDEKGNNVKSCFAYHKTLGVPYVADKEQWDARLNVMLKTLQEHLDNPPKKEVSIINLFYDANHD